MKKTARGSTRGVCTVLANMADSQTGIAYPSYNTLARRANTARMVVIRAIDEAVKLGLIEVAHLGGRQNGENVSTRYRLRLDILADADDGYGPWTSGEGGDHTVTTPQNDGEGSQHSSTTGGNQAVTTGGNQAVTTVVTKSTFGGNQNSDLVVTTRLPYPSINRGLTEVDDGFPCGDALGSAAPLAGSLARADMVQEFVMALGRPAPDLAKVAAKLDELIAGGEAYEDILAGAKRCAAYTAEVGSTNQAGALQWLKGGLWKQPWTIRQPKPKAEKVEKPKAKPKADKANAPQKAINPAYEQWTKAKAAADDAYSKRERLLGDHKDCPTCKAAMAKRDMKGLCEVVRDAFTQQNEADQALNDLGRKPQKYLDDEPVKTRNPAKDELLARQIAAARASEAHASAAKLTGCGCTIDHRCEEGQRLRAEYERLQSEHMAEPPYLESEAT